MGIPSLVPVIQHNPSLFENRILEKCQLVIDGNCVENYLYDKTGLDKSYGGEYDAYSIKVENFFRVLQKFRVSPVVVFDGAYEMDDRKLQTIKKRGQKRIDEPMNYAPLLTHETFVFVLNKMAIKHVTCDFEADREMVVLANRLQCPVLSFDTDFFIFDITGGFIAMDKIDVDLLSSGQTTSKIKVKLYLTSNLYRRFPYLRGKLGLFASALGNDYVIKDSTVIQHFYKSLVLPKPDRDIFEVKNEYFCAIIRKVLYWLENCENERQGISEVSKQMSKTEKDMLKLSISTYENTTEYSRFDLQSHLQSANFSTLYSRRDIPETAVDDTDSSLVGWLVKNHRFGKMSNFVKNAIINRRNILPCQLENIGSTSSHEFSRHLRRVIYGILLGSDVCVQEFERVGNELVERKVFGLLFPIGEHNHVPNLDDIPKMSIGEKLKILRKTLNANIPSESIPTCNLHNNLYLMILIFWLKTSRLKSDICLIKSMLLSLVILSSSESEASLAPGNFTLLVERHFEDKSSTVNTELRHSLAGFQSCLLYGKHLNSLLGRPLEDVNPAKCFSGSLIHKLYVSIQTDRGELRLRSKLNEFEIPNLDKTYCDILDFVTGSL